MFSLDNDVERETTNKESSTLFWKMLMSSIGFIENNFHQTLPAVH